MLFGFFDDDNREYDYNRLRKDLEKIKMNFIKN